MEQSPSVEMRHSDGNVSLQPVARDQATSTIGTIGDLVVALLVSVVAGISAIYDLGVLVIVRSIVGLPAALFIPGYAVTCALFPRRSPLDAIGRAGLSFTLSLALIPLAALAVDRLPGSFSGVSIVSAIMAATAILIAAATTRRVQTPLNDRFVPSLPVIELQSPRCWPRRVQIAAILAAASAVVITGSALSLVGSYVAADPTTEFAILNSSGQPEFYDRHVVQGKNPTVMLEVTNHEGEQQQYVVRVVVEGQVINETAAFEIENGDSWREQIEFTPPAGDDLLPVVFELYRSPLATDDQPYRWLRLMLKNS